MLNRSGLLHRRRIGEGGASLVEMAIVLPLFLLLIYGIIEFSWAFAQNNEVRHLAREGARVAGVHGDADDVDAAICGGASLISTDQLTYTLGGDALSEAGGEGEVAVTADYSSLTGMLDDLFSGTVLRSTHAFFTEPGHDPPNGAGC